MKTSTRAALLLAAAMMAMGCRRDYVAKGERAMAAEDYGAAEIYFRKAVKVAPRSDRALYDLGMAYLKEQDYRFSYAAFSRAVELNPKNEKARLETARILLGSGKPDRAEREAREILRYDPHSLAARLLLGAALTSQGKTDDAREVIEKAIHDQPNSSDAYVALAALEFRLQRSDKALADLDRAIELDPHEAKAYFAKAAYLRRARQLKSAISVLRVALKADPSASDIKLALADALLANGQAAEGMALLRSVANAGTPSVGDVGFQKTVARARLALAEIENNQLEAAATDLKTLEHQGAGSVPEVLNARARLALAQNKIAEAKRLFIELTDVAPNFAPGFYYLGLVYADSGELQKAIDQLHTAAELAPNMPGTYLLLAEIELKQSNYPAALDESQLALQYAPDSVPALMLEGDALYGLGRDQEAKQLFERLAKLDPRSSVVHERLGQLAAKRNDLSSAAKEFEAGLKIDPSQARLLNDLAAALWKTRGPLAALDRIRAQIKLQPKNAEFHALLGIFLNQNHQSGEAVSELKAAIDENPNAPDPYLALAKIYRSMGKSAEAERELKASLVKTPKSVLSLVVLGAMADREGHLDEAIGYYERAVALNPNFAIALNNLAYDYLRQNRNLDQALQLAQRARALMPHDPHVAVTLGEAFLKRGLPDNAVPLFREAVESDAGSPIPHYDLGFALLALKQNGDAGRELNMALKLDPHAWQAPRAREALALTAGKRETGPAVAH